MDGPGWAVLDILKHPIGKEHWEGLKCSQGHMALQGVSPESAQGCSPHPRASPDVHNSRISAVLQNTAQPPAAPQSSPSTPMALAHTVCPRETEVGRI